MEEEDEISRRRRSVRDVLGPVTFMVVCEGAMLTHARRRLALDACSGDAARAAQLLSGMMGAGALCEFLAGPLLGSLSDSQGRKPFLLASAFVLAVSRLSVFFTPRSQTTLLADRAASMAAVSALFSCVRAAHADVLDSPMELALAAGGVARYAGLAVLLGPHLDALTTRIGGGDPRFAFLAAGLLSAGVCAHVTRRFEETLDERDLRPVTLATASPLSFLSLLGSTKTMATLMGVLLLQAVSEGRSVQHVKALFMRSHLKWSDVRASNLVAASGFLAVAGALLAKESVSELGLRNHTSLGNLCQALSSTLWALAPASAPADVVLTHLSLLVSVGAQRKRDAVEAFATHLGVGQDLGKASVVAALSNWRAMAAIGAPVLLGNLFVFGTGKPLLAGKPSLAGKPLARYMPGLPFFAIAALSIVAETLFRSLPEADIPSHVGRKSPSKSLSKSGPRSQGASSTNTSANTSVNTSSTSASAGANAAPAPTLASASASASASADSAPAATFLDKSRQRVRLAEKVALSHDTRLFRFALPDASMALGLPVGKHITLFGKPPRAPATAGEWNGRPDPEAGKPEVSRKYTPTSSDADAGRVDLVVKVYRGGEAERFPDGGKLSQFLETLAVGEHVDIQGPFGRIEYKGRGAFAVRRQERTYRHLGLVCGGTGVTPALQLIKAILLDPLDETQISLLLANQTEADILLRDVIEQEAAAHPKRFRVWYTLDRPPPGWAFSEGFIDEAMLRDSMPPPSEDAIVLVCGPPPMVKFAVKPNLDKIGHTNVAEF